MDYGIGMLSVVPMRTETSDKAEIVTQLTFGECYEVVAREGNWLQLQLAADDYRGWIDVKQHTPVSSDYYKEWCNTRHPRALDLVQMVSNADVRIPVGIGCYLPFFDGMSIRIGEERYQYTGRASNPSATATPAQLIKVANSFLKAPYLWGGKSVFGIDCSGFTQLVFGICGYKLPRDAYQQVSHGEEVHFVTQAQSGDLAYFSNPEGRITHVGLVLEGQQIMHAHGEVRIDTLDHNGIYNADRKRYSHNLRIIKRIHF
ncbi:SH3 domain-containing protein [Pontibacter mucosus]|uniref:SH3 domain-containing protein n=1 Tax=Pontibacter mucosus TaxID=1649266 RepID=A0A2T5YCV1_9BACT|nr:C40 family peptidase [Pontibacter mucosus]PTX14351.1 SH3 domain-containing protein [Pontibacter mucosus]